MPTVFYVSSERRDQFEFRRLLSISCGILGCCTIGATYAVGILSNGIQRVFGMSQDDVTTIIFVGFLSAYFAYPAGWIMDRYGPRAVLILATTLTVLGWMFFSVTFSGLMLGGNVAFLSFVAFMFFWTGGFFDAATMLTNLFLFPLDRGTIVMIQKTFMSLASTVVSLTYDGFFRVPKDHHSSNATSSTTNSTNATHHERIADGIDSAEGRSMRNYCAALTVIAFVWGLGAILGVREAPALALKRNAPPVPPQQQQEQQETDQTENLLLRDNKEQQQQQQSSLSTLCLTQELDSTRIFSSGAAEQQQQQQPSQSKTEDNAGCALYFSSPTAAAVLSHCFADEDDTANTQQQRQPEGEEPNWCTDEQWESDPRIEMALIQTLPMPRPVRRVAYIVLVVNFAFLASCTLVGIYVDMSSVVRKAIAGIAHALVFAFFLLPFASRYIWKPQRGLRVVIADASDEAAFQQQANDSTQQQQQQQQQQHEKEQEEEKNIHIQHRPRAEEVVFSNPYAQRFVEWICSWDCWLFWIAMAGVSSTGGLIVGNAFQLFDSLANGELSQSAATLNVGLMGIGGAGGRVIIGLVEQFWLTPSRFSASLLLPIPSTVSLIGLILMPLLPARGLWFAFFLVSGAYGASWATLLLCARQMFVTDVAQTYLFIFSAGILSVPIARGALGPWYDAATRRQGAAPGKCLGLECVSLPIGIMSGMCCLGAILFCIFHVRWMRRNGLSACQVVPREGEPDDQVVVE